jgi:hypothetical protein
VEHCAVAIPIEYGFQHQGTKKPPFGGTAALRLSREADFSGISSAEAHFW